MLGRSSAGDSLTLRPARIAAVRTPVSDPPASAVNEQLRTVSASDVAPSTRGFELRLVRGPRPSRAFDLDAPSLVTRYDVNVTLLRHNSLLPLSRTPSPH